MIVAGLKGLLCRNRCTILLVSSMYLIEEQQTADQHSSCLPLANYWYTNPDCIEPGVAVVRFLLIHFGLPIHLYMLTLYSSTSIITACK